MDELQLNGNQKIWCLKRTKYNGKNIMTKKKCKKITQSMNDESCKDK